MKTDIVLLTCASWEPRFILGAERILSANRVAQTICFRYKEYYGRTKKSCQKLDSISPPSGYREIPIPMYDEEGGPSGQKSSAYVLVWKAVRKVISTLNREKHTFIVDISTMPRELIWIVLDLLTEDSLCGRIVYHRAQQHGEWCGTDPNRPHIVPKLGGVVSLDMPTSLLLVSGYDGERSEQFMSAFEPRRTTILYQEYQDEENSENKERNERHHKIRFGGRSSAIDLSGINCYGSDWGFSGILQKAEEMDNCSNLILSSLGPKTSAVALYRVHRRIEASSLVYAPCRNYNPDYSRGIRESLWIDWNPREII